MEKLKLKDTFLSGIIKNNPVFVLVLGMCPTLAMSYNLVKAFAMGAATMFVLICSNVMVSLLRKLIPDRIRLPAYIIIISTFVITVQLLMKRFLPELYSEMSAFIALIVVNCIIFARAESFASCNTVKDSAIDGLAMGLGFLCAICLLGLTREIITNGSVGGYKLFSTVQSNLPTAARISGAALLSAGLVCFAAATVLSFIDFKKSLRLTALLLIIGFCAVLFGSMLFGAFPKMSVGVSGPLGFAVFGVLMAIVNQIRIKKSGDIK